MTKDSNTPRPAADTAAPYKKGALDAARPPRAPEVARLDPYDGYPVLRTLPCSPALMGPAPFSGTAIGLVLHARKSLKAVITAITALGAKPEDIALMYKDYAYPEREEVLDWAVTQGVRVAPLEELPAEAAAFEVRTRGRPWLALEDGGYWAMEAYKRPALLASAKGFVEQTTKGVWTVKESGLDLVKTHLSLPDSVIKKAFECDFVGEAVTAALRRHMGQAFQGARVAVLGAAGTIGAAVAEALDRAGMKVAVFDLDPPAYWALTKHGRYSVCDTKAEAIAGRDVVVGCTGGTVLDLDDLRWLKDGVLLASASSAQVEFPLDLLRQLCPPPLPWRPPSRGGGTGGGGAPGPANGDAYRLPCGKQVVVLDGGRPINLGMAGAPEAPCFDLIMALLTAGAADLAKGFYDGQTGFIDDFDACCRRHNLDGLYRALHPGADQ